MGEAYPGSIASMHWNLFIDKEPLKTWSIPLTKERIGQMENEFTESLPGAAVFTGITRLLDNFQRRSFFSGIPLLLLMTVMLLTVLYSIAMMVSYLVQSREDDVALLRSRGVSAVQLLRLYALEGATLAVTAGCGGAVSRDGGRLALRRSALLSRHQGDRAASRSSSTGIRSRCLPRSDSSASPCSWCPP